MNQINMIDKTFNRWTILEFVEIRNSRAFWLARCKCGTERIVNGKDVRNGKSKSCGCYNIEQINKRNKTHGKSKTQEYKVCSITNLVLFKYNNF